MRFLLSLLILVCLVRSAGAAPVVTKVEPPSWWPGHTLNPVRLLVRGTNLSGARLSGARGLDVSRVSVNAAGTYLFADVKISRNARPGLRELTLTTAQGSTPVPFELLKPLPTTGRFQGFGPEDVLYLIMPDRFANGDPANDNPAKSPGLLDRSKSRHYHGGDLRGVIQRLPYLKELGVTTLWLNPWYDNNDRLNDREKYTLENKLDPVGGSPITDYHGYGAIDFYGVEERLGDLATLRELVDTAHALGLKVVQDQVANHVGPFHPWTTDPPTPTWFHGTTEKHPENTWQTWTVPDPYATQELRANTLDGWFINLLPDLNQDDPEGRRYLIQNALWWVGITGIDGVRQDTLPYVPRTFWRDWSAALKRQHPNLTLLGEVFDADTTKVSFYQTGQTRFDGVDSGIDSLFDFPLFYRLRETFGEGKPIKPVAEQLARDHVYENPSLLVTFVGLHDVDRFMNVKGADTTGLQLALTFILTSRGIPLIYYGDELALPGGGDPDNRRDFPGGFPGDPRDAFTDSGRSPAEAAVWNRIRDVAQLRQRSEALKRGRLVHLDVQEYTYAFARIHGSERLLIAFNSSLQPQMLTIPVRSAGWSDGQTLKDQLGSGLTITVTGGRVQMNLPARTAVILQ
ncbi:MAG: cyclomaltodextrinase N-terminal domain-containing protein [Verrucomicrobia bacterium]|nr:cyclomaltodextrinase N-terminal domain-containing protein [Verrucomicrobiota bacterium]